MAKVVSRHGFSWGVLVVCLLASPSLLASGTLLDLWGVELTRNEKTTVHNPLSFEPDYSTPGKAPGTLKYWVEDYSSTQGTSPTPGDPEGELFDVEAMYVNLTETQLQVAIVTSYPHGVHWPNYDTGSYVVSGDLALDFTGDDAFQYDFGVDLTADVRQSDGSASTAGSSVGNTIYKTELSDWYYAAGVYGHNPGSDGPFTNFDPSYSGLTDDDKRGTATVANYQYDYKNLGDELDGNDEELGYFTWVYEVTIDLADLKLDSLPGTPALDGIFFNVSCLNDPSHPYDPDNALTIPEPCTMVLSCCMGLVGVFATRRRKRRLSA